MVGAPPPDAGGPTPPDASGREEGGSSGRPYPAGRHRQPYPGPGAASTYGGPAASGATSGSAWYHLYPWVPALSVGMLAALPVLYAAVKLRRTRLWVETAVYVAVTVAAFALLESDPAAGMGDDADYGVRGSLGGLGIVGLMVAGVLHGYRLRPEALAPPRPLHHAVDQARERTRLRAEARRLAAREPELARELRIGRPDLPRSYDDGGLVDLDSAPAEVLVRELGLTRDQADRVVAAREVAGGFSGVDEVSVLADLPPSVTDAFRDRAVFLRP